MISAKLRKRFGLKKKAAEDHAPPDVSQTPRGRDDAATTPALEPTPTSRSTFPSLLPTPTNPSSRLRSSKSPAPRNVLGLHIVYTPPGPVKANIVFIHGLGGTSHATWSKNRDADLFWPRVFLPQERDINSARILTFGYNAEVKGRSSSNVKSVLDFAKDLLYDLKYSKDENTEDLNIGSVPLVFVAHSMGGLIVKEAYMQGQFDPEYERIVKAVSAILFMSTPHRGTDLAETLNRILQVSFVSAPRQYIDDLVKNSSTVQKINEQFRHLAPRLSIVSFYETQPTSMGPAGPRIMVLEKDSSVLGYPGEVSKPLDADHHTVCKFDGTDDPNYITVRNYLKSHMSKLFARQSSRASTGSGTPLETRDLETFFAITDPSDTDYIFFRDRWTPGTCEWVLHRPEFVRWLDPTTAGPQLLWFQGLGGSGKSILASFIVNHLVQEGSCCQYVFVRFSDQGKRSLGWILRSLAFQMAQSLPAFRSALGSVSRGFKLRGADPRTIWQRVFKAALLRIDFAEPLYWVIDGLDECDDSRQAVKLLGDLLQTASPIRIVILSRRSSDIDAELKKVPSRWEVASREGHCDDFRIFIDQELEWADIPEFKDKITQQLLETAQGNFLWLRLTVDRINRCHTEEDVARALKELPPGMEDLFDRVAQSISDQDDTNRTLTTSLLSWATCSIRPLTVLDLSQALNPDAPRVLNLQRSILELCGGFLVVDNGGTVDMIHRTAREYLLNPKGRPFGIDKRASHEKIFLRCLTFLSMPGLRARIGQGEDPGFLSYAASFWTAHLQACNNASQDVATSVVKFLRSPSVLTWIQAVSQAGNLHFLIHASTHLSSFAVRLSRVNADKMPLDHHVTDQELIKSWATDLSKIVGKFGSQLLRSPDSIYRSIPPFCPADSAIYKQFNNRDTRNIVVTGSTTTSWDDGVARLSFGNDYQASAILAEGSWILISAIKDNATTVFVYRADTFQEVRRIEHGERVRMIQINRLGTLLISCGYSTTRVWDLTTGICLARATNPSGRPRPQSISFVRDDTCVLISSEDRRVWLLSISGEDSLFEELIKIMDRNLGGGLVNSPVCSAISSDGNIVALGYRKSPLSVWEVGGSKCLAHCPELERIQAIMWHPFSGEILGMHTGGVVFKWEPDSNHLIKVAIGASSMAISPKGNLLATGDSRGNISLLLTSDLGLVYRAVCEDPVLGITFSVDGLRLYDVRHSYGNIWEPSVLIKLSEPASQGDTGSESDTLSPQLSLSETLYNRVDPVTALSAQPDGRLFCTGSEEGVAAIHSVGHTRVLELKRSSTFMSIEQLAWNDDGTLVCAADLSRTISVHRINPTPKTGEDWKAETLIDVALRDLDGNIDQLIFQPMGDLLLVGNNQTAIVVSIKKKEVVLTQNISSVDRKWINHPFSNDHLILLSASTADIYTWGTLEKISCVPIVVSPEEHAMESHSRRKESNSIETEVPNVSVQKLLLCPSRHFMLMQLSLQMHIDDQPQSLVRFLDISPLNSPSPNNMAGLSQDMTDLDLDSEPPFIAVVKLPEELLDCMCQPLSFVAARGSGPEMLLFLDCDSSIRSWRFRRQLKSQRISQSTPSLSRTLSSSTKSPSDSSITSPASPFAFGYDSSRSTPGSPKAEVPRKSITYLPASTNSLLSDSSSRRSTVSVAGFAQPQTVSHYCLPSDWVSPDCVKLLHTLSDGTLLCPHNGQVSIVKCRSLSG
ncbi:hypothetical protein QBC34DRAFT_412670 [Podospora aff. communis PSN243]|uniref:NACHT domain-containing protein n=1 Tax=Podospora aff. communis PSN243 TaxID=3040156 RepID=A0AAV9GF55_9PEZI|nr:hypothetical protein QBC34DRAFT_412670 [Podospora aff. communis PSN243]